MMGTHSELWATKEEDVETHGDFDLQSPAEPVLGGSFVNVRDLISS